MHNIIMLDDSYLRISTFFAPITKMILIKSIIESINTIIKYTVKDVNASYVLFLLVKL